jgi:hypothetical protein
LHIQDLSVYPRTPTHDLSAILLGRVFSRLSVDLLELGDESFHRELQTNLLGVFGLPGSSGRNLGFAISIEIDLWPGLSAELLALVGHADPSVAATALDCIGACFENGSLPPFAFAGPILGILQTALAASCPPDVLLATLGLLYCSGFAAEDPRVILELIKRLDGDHLARALADLNNGFSNDHHRAPG